jgi:di/tricarboxylate transporter
VSADLVIVLALLGAAIVMFSLNRPRSDAVALIMMVLLPFTGLITVNEALAGFANPNIVLIAAMFVIGEALARTGVAQGIGDWLVRRGGSGPTRLIALLMGAVALLGSVMSSTGVVAIFVPVVLRIASRTGVAAGQLMMPMGFAALISGMLTLVATAPNLVVNYELVREGTAGFRFFDFAPFGVPILLAAILYMLLARRWLRSGACQAQAEQGRPTLDHWIERYGLAVRGCRVRVRPGSPLVGRALGALDRERARDLGARIVLIERGEGRARRFLPRGPNRQLRAGDVLLIDLDRQDGDLTALAEEFAVDVLPPGGSYFADHTQNLGLVEAMLPVDSELVGKAVWQAEEAALAELSVVGLRRGRDALEPRDLRDRVLKVGDTVLLAGPWKTIRRLRGGGRDLVVLNLPREADDVLPAARRAPHALITLGIVVALMATGVIPNVQAALIGCLLMGLFRCIDLDKAYRAIHWKSLILIVGMLPFALALDRAGGVDLAAALLVTLVGDAGPYAILALLFTITFLFTLFVGNTATAVLMIPIALEVAEDLQASPYPFAMIIALAASTAFMSPISPINTMVATAGNYSFGDFVRVGLPLTLITLVLSVVLVPLVFPIQQLAVPIR